MPERKLDGQKLRMIHIRIPEEARRQLKIRAAELDKTMQDLVLELIQKELNKSKKK